MNKEKRLLINTLIFFIANFATKMLSFLLVPFYTFYLSQNDYGYFDLVLTTISLITPIVSFQITDSIYRYLLDENVEQKQSIKIIDNGIKFLVYALGVFNIVYLIGSNFLGFQYKILILLQINFSILSAAWQQIVRGMKRNKEFAFSGVLQTAIMLVANIVSIVFLKLGVMGLISSNVLALLAVLIYLESRTRILRLITFSKLDKKLIKDMLAYSIPMLPNSVSWWIASLSDRYVINGFIGMSANGVYAVSNKFTSLIVLANNIFYMAWQESAISEYNSEDRNHFYTKMFNTFLTIQFTVVIMLLPLTRLIFPRIIDAKFTEAYLYIPYLYIAAIFTGLASFYGTGYLSRKETKGLFYSSALAAVLKIIISIGLVGYLKIYAAAISTMVSYIVLWVYRIIDCKKFFNVKIPFKKLIILIVILIFNSSLYYLDNNMIQIFAFIFSSIIFIIFNRAILIKAYSKIPKLGVKKK